MSDLRKWGWRHLLDRGKSPLPIVHSTSKHFTSQEIESAGFRIDYSIVPDVIIGPTAPHTPPYVKYLIVPSWQNPRWMVPHYPRLIKNLGGFVKPSSRIARAVWRLARILNFVGGMGLMFRDNLFIRNDALSVGKDAFSSRLPVLYTGTYGPYQKFTVQLMSPQGDISEFWKIGDHTSATQKVRDEKNALSYLQDVGLRYNQVPSISWYRETNNYNCLAITPCLSIVNKLQHRFSEGHFASLLEIQQATLREEGPDGIENRLNCFSESISRLPKYDYRNIRRCITHLIHKTQSRNLPRIKVCLSHGDYSPWNVFISESHACVFDWELMEVRPILWDFFNFVFHAETLVNKNQGKNILQTFHDKDLAFFIRELLRHAGQENYYAGLYLDIFLLELSIYYLNYNEKLLDTGFNINYAISSILANLSEMVKERASYSD